MACILDLVQYCAVFQTEVSPNQRTLSSIIDHLLAIDEDGWYQMLPDTKLIEIFTEPFNASWEVTTEAMLSRLPKRVLGCGIFISPNATFYPSCIDKIYDRLHDPICQTNNQATANITILTNGENVYEFLSKVLTFRVYLECDFYSHWQRKYGVHIGEKVILELLNVLFQSQKDIVDLLQSKI